MRLNVRDVSDLLHVSEKTVYRWIKQRDLPHYKVEERFKFNREELQEWATRQGVEIAPDLARQPQEQDAALPSLVEALQAGGIHHQVGGHDQASVLEAVVALLPLPAKVDRGFLYQVLLAREAMGSTAIGNGIAIPHVRNPIVLHIPRPMIALCFLERPVDFGSLDGRAVEVLFTLISPTVRAHLHLLSKLSFALRDPPFEKAVKGRETSAAIMDAAQRLEERLRLSADWFGKFKQT